MSEKKEELKTEEEAFESWMKVESRLPGVNGELSPAENLRHSWQGDP